MVDAVDVNADGWADVVDSNGDGYFESAAPSSGSFDPAASMTPGIAPGTAFDAGGGGTGIDINGDGTVDGYDTNGDGWVDAVGPGAISAAQANGYSPGGGGGPFPAGQAPPEDPGRYTVDEINQGYSSYDTSFIEPARFADDSSLISNNDITDVL